MKKYAINGLSASGTGPKSAFSAGGATTARPLASEITFGVRTNPNATDQQVEFAVGTLTALGTAGSAPTPKPLDFIDPVPAIVVAGITHSAEPTYAATYFLDTDMNQRGLFRWVAETGFELASNVGAAIGIGGKMILVTAAVVMSQVVHYKERSPRRFEDFVNALTPDME